MCGRNKDNSEATQESVEYLFVYMYLFISPHTVTNKGDFCLIG